MIWWCKVFSNLFACKTLINSWVIEWFIYALVNQVIIGIDDGLSSVRHITTIWTNARMLLIVHRKIFHWYWINIRQISSKKVNFKITFTKRWQSRLGLNMSRTIVQSFRKAFCHTDRVHGQTRQIRRSHVNAFPTRQFSLPWCEKTETNSGGKPLLRAWPTMNHR